MTYPQTIPLALGAHTDAAGRPANEDTCAVHFLPDQGGLHNQQALLLVADGMGGGHSGRTASQLALSTVEEQYLEAVPPTPPLLALQQAVNRANSAVYAYSSTAGKAGTVGTTIVAAAIHGPYASIVSLGDSPAYLIRNQHANRITRDHNWANQQIDNGSLTPEQAYAHENARLLTHIVGRTAHFPIAETGQPDDHCSYLVELQPGDAIVLCSDGISEVLPPAELATLAISAPPQEAAQALVERAKARATRDNATAAVMHYGRQAAPSNNMVQWLPFTVGGGIFGIGILLFLVLVAFVSAHQFASGKPSVNPILSIEGSTTTIAPTRLPVQAPDTPEPVTLTFEASLPIVAEPTRTLAAQDSQTATAMQIDTQAAATQTAWTTASPFPTSTLAPTATPLPTATSVPTTKKIVPPTATSVLPPTDTPTPPSTDTPTPPSTDTPTPPSTDTPTPPSTDTPTLPDNNVLLTPTATPKALINNQ